MVWQPKAGTPATFDQRDAFAALITGDATWGWLVDWLPFIDPITINTAAFCALGPPTVVPLTAPIFANFPPRNPIAFIGQTAIFGQALLGVANDRLFAAYCEQPAGAAGTFGADNCFSVSAAGDSFPAVTPIWMVPAGATRVRGKISAFTGSFGLQLRYYSGMTSPAGPFTGLTPLLYGDQTTLHNGDFNVLNVTGGGVYASIHMSGTATLCVAFDPPAAVGWTATPQPLPAGMTAHPATGADLASIARELDRQEAKLDFIQQLCQTVIGLQPTLPGSVLDFAVPVVNANTPISLVGAIGVVVTLSAVPVGADVSFGTPQQLAEVGRVNFGTALAWYPSIPITHTPLVIRPLPPETTRVTVTVPPVISATVTPILPPK